MNWTVLDIAVKNELDDIVALLLAYGGNINLQNHVSIKLISYLMSKFPLYSLVGLHCIVPQ